MTNKIFALALILGIFWYGLSALMPANAKDSLLKLGEDIMNERPDDFKDKGYEVATLAGGCFWCTESEYRALDGVVFTRVGYMGGELQNPTYQDITTGRTGHAEIVEVTYDPKKINYAQLLEFFLTKAHDPTQLNRQGVDVGTQYRSEIFIHSDEQFETAQQVIARIDEQKIWKNPIVTKVSPAETFWAGEDYHQQYYEKYQEKTGRDHIRVILKQAKKLKP